MNDVIEWGEDLVEDYGDFISDPLGTKGAAEDAAEASISAASIAAGSQQEALDYLKETEALPQEIREQALTGLQGAFGMGGEGDQQQFIQGLIDSPLYSAMMGGQEAGEEAILRSAGATGGLRSGSTQSAMYDYNTQLQNQALLQSYNQQVSGMQGLAGLPSNANQIAGYTSGIGQTLAQGQIGAATAIQQGNQQNVNNLMGLGGLGIAGYNAFSDRRLKKNIKEVGEVKGIPWFTWEWNSVGEMLGCKGSCQGTMAEIAFEINPDTVFIKNNFLMVNYSALGVL